MQNRHYPVFYHLSNRPQKEALYPALAKHGRREWMDWQTVYTGLAQSLYHHLTEPGNGEMSHPQSLRPEILGQGMTAVYPEYRNRGLGRLLKAAMLEKVLRERPQVKLIRTGNADSNAPMLKINTELGFKRYMSQVIWQVETEKVIQYLFRK